MIISSCIFFIFPKFWLTKSIGEKKDKKWSRMTKYFVCCTPYLRNYTSFDCHLWCKCVKLYLQVFFFKFKISIFWVVRGLKGQKMTQSDKKFYLSHSVSQEPYIIWLWSSYDVHHMTAFLIIICFSSSSINGKKKFWGVPHLLHLCVIFYQQYLLSENDMLPNFYITSSTPQNELSPTPRKGKKNKVE